MMINAALLRMSIWDTAGGLFESRLRGSGDSWSWACEELGTGPFDLYYLNWARGDSSWGSNIKGACLCLSLLLPFLFLFCFYREYQELCEQRGHLERSCEEEREGIKIKVAEPIVVYRIGALILSGQSFFCLPHKIFLILKSFRWYSDSRSIVFILLIIFKDLVWNNLSYSKHFSKFCSDLLYRNKKIMKRLITMGRRKKPGLDTSTSLLSNGPRLKTD